MATATKFSEDVVPLSDLEVKPGKIVHVVTGLADLYVGQDVDLDEAKRRLCLSCMPSRRT